MEDFSLPDYVTKHPRDVTTDEICAIYKGIAEIPNIDDGGILSVYGKEEKTISCYALFSQKDLESNSTRKFEKQYTIHCPMKAIKKGKGNACAVKMVPAVSESRNVICQTYSLDGTMKALVRSVKDEDKDKQYLEIWSSCRLVKNVNLSAVDAHGKVYGSGTFASLSFSEDNRKVLYVAEKKETPSGAFFERKSQSKKEKENAVPGDKFVYKEDWGEQLVGQSDPVLVVFDVRSGAVSVLDGISEDLSPGQACWGPNGAVVFVGYKNKPMRLGLIYCDNRSSAVYCLKMSENGNTCQQLSGDNQCAYSPRVSPCHRFMVFLERGIYGPHKGCERLMLYDFDKEDCSVLYDIVLDNAFGQGAPFGIFAHQLPRRCWLKTGDHSHIIFTTSCGVSKSIVTVSLHTGKMSLLGILMQESCQTVLDVQEGFVLFLSSAMNSVSDMAIVYVHEEDLKLDAPTFNGTVVQIDNLASCVDQPLSRINTDMESRLVQSVVTVEFDGCGKFESVFLHPSNYPSPNLPLIAWLHGGPHSLFSAAYLHYAAAFAYLGFAVLLVNYRGSLGFGELSLTSLLGKIGDQDVKDCYSIVDHVVRRDHKVKIDPNNVFLFGGSHGGFLATHLIGQYPEYFRAAVTRNPVVNLVSKLDASDIPDWGFVGAGYGYDDQALVTGERCKRMFEMSPLAHVNDICTPLLILIGLDDLRVPPSQGINFHRVLKRLGKKTRLLTYPGNTHALSKVEAEGDVFVNTVLWFKGHMK